MFIRGDEGTEAIFPISIVPAGSPTVESIFPNSASPGTTTLLYLTGMALVNPIVTTISDELLISSYRSSNDGTILYLSVSLTPNVIPAIYQLYVNTIGGQAQANFIVTNTTVQTNDSFSGDPYSPGIFSVEANPNNKNQLILKGTRFEDNPIVTIIQNNNGDVVSKQINIEHATNNEIVVSLPEDINSENISFAVTSADGKSSNIKTIELSSLYNPPSENPTDTNFIPGTNIISVQEMTGTTIISENSQKNEPSGLNNETRNTQPIQSQTNFEEIVLAPNIQYLTQVLLNEGSNSPKEKIELTSINDLKDPAKLLSSIEENKQIKNQTDLIMAALNEAQNAKDSKLQETLRKQETLKSKVEELEKLLKQEELKDKPNKRKLVKYQKLLESASAESRSQTFTLLNNLLKYKPQLKNQLIQKPFDLAAIQSNIPSDSVILQYVPTEEGLIIFVVDKNNLKTRVNKDVSKEILNHEVKAFRQLFENEIEKINNTGRVTPISSWKNDKSKTYLKEILPLKERSVFLYNALLKPVEKDLIGKNVVAIIANGWLRYLPFQSLGKLTPGGDLEFIISQKSVVYLDTVLALSKSNPSPITSTSNITIFANPDKTLAGANKEAEIITMLFSMTTKAITQTSFNKALINQYAKSSDILHIATHGHFSGEDASASYLITGQKIIGKNTIPEKLYLKDIYDLNLKNSKLVVLSGCDTGKIGSLNDEPEDLLGSLAAAFRVAGANTLLASLWKAHDNATKIIMENFYKNMKNGLNKAEALRQALLKVKENPQYGHPLFWSLFNLVGDWR